MDMEKENRKMRDMPDIADICGRIYDIADENMRKQGGVMKLSRQAFLDGMDEDPNKLDLRPLANASNDVFFSTVYRQVFRDAPLEAVTEYWEPFITSMPEVVFRRKFLKAIVANRISNKQKIIIVE